MGIILIYILVIIHYLVRIFPFSFSFSFFSSWKWWTFSEHDPGRMGLGFRFASPLVATRWPKVWPRHAASPSLGQMLTVEEEPLGPKNQLTILVYCWLGGKLQNQLHWLAHTVVEFLGAEVVLRVAWGVRHGRRGMEKRRELYGEVRIFQVEVGVVV